MINIKFEIYNKRAVAMDEQKEIGECTFSKSETSWIINHTRVSEDYKGQGIAKKLVEEVVEQARKSYVKLNATCSYALKLFNSTNEYDDVVRK